MPYSVFGIQHNWIAAGLIRKYEEVGVGFDVESVVLWGPECWKVGCAGITGRWNVNIRSFVHLNLFKLCLMIFVLNLLSIGKPKMKKIK